jgi:hypothetical protein
MTKGEMLRESQYIDLNDEDLKELLGYLSERIRLDQELSKTDPDIVALRDQLKDLIADKYGESIKVNKKRLKAARAVASQRNLDWKVLK